MPKQTAPLGIIMSVLGISLTETADYLQIDKTTVSKWRTGSRKMSPKSAYFERLTELFAYENSKKTENPLSSFFKGMFTDLDPSTDSYIEDCLKKFLSSDSAPAVRLNEQPGQPVFFPQTAAVLYGIDGLKKALETLLSFAENSPVPYDIRMMELGKMDWLSFDMPFLQSFLCRLDALVKKGCKVQVAYSVQNDDQALRIFLQSFDMLSYKKDVVSFLIDITHIEGIVPTLFTIGEKCSLRAFGQDDDMNELCTGIFFDEPTSKKNVQLFEKVITRFGNPITVSQGASQNNGLIQTIADSYANNTNRLGYFGDYLSVVTMEESLLTEILETNQLDDEIKKSCLLFYRTLRHSLNITGEEKPNVYFLNMGALENTLQYDSLIEYELSALTQRQIVKTAAQYRRHLSQAAEWMLGCKNIRLCRLPGFQQRRTAGTWLKKNCYGLSMNYLLIPDQYQLIYFDNPKLVDIVFDLCSLGLKNINYHDTIQVVDALKALSAK